MRNVYAAAQLIFVFFRAGADGRFSCCYFFFMPASTSAPGLPTSRRPEPMGYATTVRQWLSRPENQLLPLLLLLALPLYFELGRSPIQLWDESRLANNAAEMAQHGHWLVPHYDGTPDHWNTKPPLLIWLEALSFRVFGFSTWAFRLPTLLATLGTVGLLFRFAARVLRQPLAGLLGTVVLVTCAGYVRLHVARTGDYDALLIFWQVLLWSSFFQYLETGQHRELGWVTVAVIAGTLTKGPAGLLGVPGLLLYALLRGKLIWLLRQPLVYAAGALWVVVTGGYLLGREAIDPGYWRAVQENDLGGRFLAVIEGHSHGWSYYLENLRTRFFTNWLWAVPLALVLGWLQPAGVLRRAVGLLTAFVIGWLVVISAAKSKLEWYEGPVYPALALLIGIGLSLLYQNLVVLYPQLSGRRGWLAQAALAVGLLYLPYASIFGQLIEERHSDFTLGADAYLGRYLPKLARERPELDKVTLLYRGDNYYDAVLHYYRHEFEQWPGHELNARQGKDLHQLTAGTIVTVCDPAYRVALDSTFQLVELHQDYPCQTVLLLARPK